MTSQTPVIESGWSDTTVTGSAESAAAGLGDEAAHACHFEVGEARVSGAWSFALSSSLPHADSFPF